jgi:FkbM family methyltransferase
MNLSKIICSLPWRARCLLSSKHEILLFHLPTGGLVHYPIRSQIGYALFRGTFETAELRFVTSLLRPGDTFVDIGANAGIFTVAAAQVIGQFGQIFAYEPAAFEAALLHLNVAHNRLENVVIRNVGVSDREGEADFVISEDGAMNSLFRTDHPNQRPVAKTRIHTTTLDAILANVGLGKLRLIKIDTEGAERQIILPALARLKKLSGVRVLFESQDTNNRGFGYTTKQFLQELEQAGANVCQLMDDGSTTPINSRNHRIGDTDYNFVLNFD